MAIETTTRPQPQEKKVWVVIDVPWLAQRCGVQPTGEVRVVLGKIHLEAVIPDIPATANIPAGALVTATGQSLFIPHGIALITE